MSKLQIIFFINFIMDFGEAMNSWPNELKRILQKGTKNVFLLNNIPLKFLILHFKINLKLSLK